MANELYGISVLVSFTLFFSIIYLICYRITDTIKSRHRINEIKAEKEYESLYKSDFAECIATLNAIIDLEFLYTVELPFEGKDIKRISDFEGTLKSLTVGVTRSINKNLIIKFESVGIDQDYIYSYITRTCTIKIISYMKETNTGVAKKEDEEE